MSMGMILVIVGIAGILCSVLGLGIESTWFKRRAKKLMKEMEADQS